MHGIDVSVGNHLRQRLRRTDAGELELGRQLQLELLVAAGLLLAASEIFDASRIDAVLVLQDAADPYRCGHLIFRSADAFSNQVPGFADAALGRNENARLAEKSRWEHGNRDERRLVARDRHGVGG